jgi:hypothetical protein
LWLNFADLQLGMIDASKNAQRLVAVRYFSTGANYAVGDFVIQAGALYVAATAISSSAFVPSQWTKIATAADMSGSNRLLNGDMQIDQRNGGASWTPGTGAYTADRWKFQGTQSGKFTAQRVASGAGVVALGWPYQLGLISASAYAFTATDSFAISQFIEADMISDFAWGTPNAQPVTLSFMAAGSIAGTYSGSIRNDTNTRSYPFSFSLVANTWTKVVITIPGDTAGTWVLSGNALGLYVAFDLGSGANLRGPANAWATTTSPGYTGVTGAVSIVATNGAFFYLTGVKLEIGSVATPYNRQTMAKSMADCQRYYQSVPGLLTAINAPAAGATGYLGYTLPVTMRASPTALIGTLSNVVNCSSQTITVSGFNSFYNAVTATAAGLAYYQSQPTFSAEL